MTGYLVLTICLNLIRDFFDEIEWDNGLYSHWPLPVLDTEQVFA